MEEDQPRLSNGQFCATMNESKLNTIMNEEFGFMWEEVQRRVQTELLRNDSGESVREKIGQATVSVQAVIDAHFGKAATAALGVLRKRNPTGWNVFFREKCKDIIAEHEIENGKGQVHVFVVVLTCNRSPFECLSTPVIGVAEFESRAKEGLSRSGR
jgi:hypothetical protein